MKKYHIVFTVLLLLFLFILPGGRQTEAADPVFGFILPDSGNRYLSPEEISDMGAQVACYARNEIFARNGRIFDSAELQNYFSAEYWYSATYTADQFTTDMLNPYEQANVVLLQQQEQTMGSYLTDGVSYSYDPVYEYIAGHTAMLNQDEYTVDPSSYIFHDSDECYLTEEDIEPLSAQELCYARNEIYARHGMIFSSAELSEYFSQKNWYWGTLTQAQFSPSLLNSCENANIQLFQARENALVPGGYVLDQNYTYQNIGTYSGGTVTSSSAQDYIFPDSSTRYLTDDEAASLSLQQLCYARNEIYARRGYIFQSQELRDYFGSKSWYNGTIPASEFSSAVFNEFEKANVELLKKYEFSVNPNGYQTY